MVVVAVILGNIVWIRKQKSVKPQSREQKLDPLSLDFDPDTQGQAA